jgi:hypothetical protein
MRQGRATKHRIIAYGISLIILILIGLKLLSYYKHNVGVARVTAEQTTPRELDIVFGNDSATLTVYMYSSYTCHFCRLFFAEVFPLLDSAYIKPGKVKLLMRLVDLSSNYQMNNANRTAVCIGRYGYFGKLHELLLTDYRVIFAQEFTEMVNEFTMKDAHVAECILGHEADDYLGRNRADFEKLGIKGTPAFIIDRNIYLGFRKYEEFRDILELHLGEK